MPNKLTWYWGYIRIAIVGNEYAPEFYASFFGHIGVAEYNLEIFPGWIVTDIIQYVGFEHI